jgi:formylglycine-generating enzyme required for sulfatase activity
MEENNLSPISDGEKKRTSGFLNMVWIPGGTFSMGSDKHYPEEGPSHNVTVNGFWMDKYPVTNKEYKKFVDATNYVTVAERPLNPNDYPGAPAEAMVPGSLVFFKPKYKVSLDNISNWWGYVHGACWKNPEGPESTLEKRWEHPVVHMAWEDVEAYATWAGKKVPSEAEWEFACRGGLEKKIYEWGDELMPEGKMMANFWVGEFPWKNLSLHGFEKTSYVGAFPFNGYGLHDMTGNVWEWTEDWYEFRHQHDPNKSCCIPVNPKGGRMEYSFDSRQPQFKIARKVLKGGSHLCAKNYCYRFRPAARHAQMVDSGASHIGFRCIIRTTIVN